MFLLLFYPEKNLKMWDFVNNNPVAINIAILAFAMVTLRFGAQELYRGYRSYIDSRNPNELIDDQDLEFAYNIMDEFLVIAGTAILAYMAINSNMLPIDITRLVHGELGTFVRFFTGANAIFNGYINTAINRPDIDLDNIENLRALNNDLMHCVRAMIRVMRDMQRGPRPHFFFGCDSL